MTPTGVYSRLWEAMGDNQARVLHVRGGGAMDPPGYIRQTLSFGAVHGCVSNDGLVLCPLGFYCSG